MRTTIAFFALFLLMRCAPNVSPNSYSVGSVGEVNRTVAGTIISARSVKIDGTSGLGSASGTVVGATAGSALGGGVRSNISGAVGGALIGGVAGALAENAMTKQVGMEYVIQRHDRNLMTIVQGDTPSYIIGTKVLVLYGSPSRIILDPRV